MTDAYVTCNGERLSTLSIMVGNVGPWVADLDFIDAPAVTGACEIRVGDTMVLRGAVVAPQAGTHLEQRKCRVVGGAGGWSRVLSKRHYHNDLGVKAQLVADDAAREVGETIGVFEPAATRLGRDFVRAEGIASRTLESVIGGVPWRVGYDGQTHIGVRDSYTLSVDSGYDVLNYDPRNRVITFSVDDPAVIGIGATLSGPPLESPQTIREYELHFDGNSTRAIAWVGGNADEPGRLAGLVRAIAERATDGMLFGKYRYRVVAMHAADNRVELQAVRKGAGLPDLRPIAQWPGVPGALPDLAAGAEVLVEFIEGDPTQPIITGYAGKGAPGFVPVGLTLGGTTGAPAARQGDTVSVLLPPATFAGTLTVGGVPQPLTGVAVFAPVQALGVITGGSTKVKVAT